MSNTHILPQSLMGTVTRTRLLTAVFCLSLAGLGVAANGGLLGQATGSIPPVIRNTIIDNDPLSGDDVPGFFTDGFLLSPNGALPGALNDNVAYLNLNALSRATKAYATWTFANLAPGKYVFYATWKSLGDGAKKAPYSNSLTSTTVYADQTAEPVGIEVNGRSWYPVAKTEIKKGDTMVITLRGNPEGGGTFVLADGMLARLESSTIGDGPTIPPVEPGSCPKIKPLCLIGSPECCGNGQWACPNGATGASGCQPTIPPVEPGSCGDGVTQENEQCDDGNQNAFDGCGLKCIMCPMPSMAPPPPGCTYVPDPTIAENGCPKYPGGVLKCDTTGEPMCGNGKIESPEECDDRNRRPGDGCNSMCKKEFCGDGIVTVSLGENCDEGAANGTVHGNYKCSTPKCVWAYCGDKIVQEDLGEQCDGTEGCTPDCKNVATVACKYQPRGLGQQCEMMLATKCASLRGTQYATIDECRANIAQCADGIDNDGDKLTDLADKGCSSSTDTNEGDGNTSFTVSVKTQSPTATPGTTFTSSLVITNLGPDRVTSPVSFIIDPPEGFSVPERSGDGRCVRQQDVENGVWTCTIKPEEFNGASQYFKSSFNMQVNANAICNTSSELAVFMSSTPQGAGANSSSKTPVKIVCSTQQSCKETDGGNVPEVAGTLTAFIRSSTTGQLERVEVKDSCVGTNPEVIEGYCVPDGLGGQNYSTISVKCPFGCADGACKKEGLLLGDMDKNNKIDINDRDALLKVVESGVTPTADQLARGDLNKNERLTAADAHILKGYLDGKLTSIPAKVGDVTGDMNVTSLDASRVSQMIPLLTQGDDRPWYASITNLYAQLTIGDITQQMRFLADANADGVIDQRDVQLILEAATGVRFELPVFTFAEESSCTDTDGGDNMYVKGVAQSKNPQANEVDLCIDGTKLKERYCDTNKLLQTKEITCPLGCNDGACKKSPVSQCEGPARTTAMFQNPTLTVDVNNDTIVDKRDIEVLLDFYNMDTVGYKTPVSSFTYTDPVTGRTTSYQNVFVNVDGSFNEKGVESFTIDDFLAIINYMRCNAPKLSVTSANFSCSADGVPSIALGYVASAVPGPVHLFGEQGQWLYTGEDLASSKTSANLTLPDNIVLPQGMKVKICDKTDKTKCSALFTSTGTPCQQKIDFKSIVLETLNGVDVYEVTYKKNFRTCAHMFLDGDKSAPKHKQNVFCTSTDPTAQDSFVTVEVPAKPTASNPSGGLDVSVGNKVVLCHGNNANICNATAVEVTRGSAPVTCGQEPRHTGAKWQNVYNSFDVDGNWKIEAADVTALTYFMSVYGQGTPGAGVVSSLKPDVNGDNSVDAQDVLIVSTHVDNNCGQQSITVNGPASLACVTNATTGQKVSTVTMNYVAKFIMTNLHVRMEGSSVIPGTMDPTKTTGTVDYAKFTGATANTKVYLCHGNDSKVCSTPVAIQGTGCATTTAPAGNLFVTQSSTPVRPQQLLGGVLSPTIFSVTFRADETEDIRIDKLRVMTAGSRGAGIERLNIVKPGGIAVGVATTAACADFGISTFEGVPVQTFCAPFGNAVVVPKGQSVTLLIAALMRTDANGAVSGEPIQLMIDTSGGGGGGGGTMGGLSGQVGQTFTTFGFVEATGVQSNAKLTLADGNTTVKGKIYVGTETPGTPVAIRGTKHVTVLSKLMSIANANADVDGTAVPTGVSPIGQFKFSAATNSNSLNGLNSVSIQKLQFSVTSTNVTLGTSYKVYNKADTSTKATCTVTGGGGAMAGGGNPAPSAFTTMVECAGLDASGADFSLQSGEQAVYVLEADILNAQTNKAYASNVQASLQNFANPTAIVDSNSVLWQDKDLNTNAKTFPWFDQAETMVKSTNYGTPAGPTVLADNATCNTMPGYSIRNIDNVIAGSNFQATIVMDNPGPSTWVVGANTPYNLSILPETNWGLAAATHNSVVNQPAETQVKPGYVFSFDFWPLKAPSTPGTYPIKVQMKKNGAAFGSVCTYNIVVKPATQPPVLTGDNCPDVKTAKQQMSLFGTAGKFRATSDGKYLMWAEVVSGMSKNVKGVDFDTCVTTLYGTAETQKTGIDEISISDNGKILYKDRTVIGDGTSEVYKLWLVDKATKSKTLVTDKAISNGTGDRGLISRDGKKVVLTATNANIDNDPATATMNTKGRAMFVINLATGVITQVTNFNGGQSPYRDAAGNFIPNQWTNMKDAQFEDNAGRFITVDLDWNPTTGKRHERDVLTTATQPSDIYTWEYRLYLYDTQTKAFYKVSDTKNPIRENLRAQINAKIAEITGGTTTGTTGTTGGTTGTTGTTGVLCGNTIIDAGEQCDDGNRNDGDVCSSSCTLPASAKIVIDDGDAGFSPFPTMTLSQTPNALAYGSDSTTCTNTRGASYVFSGLDDTSEYDVYATWKAAVGADTQLQYSIPGYIGTGISTTVNQTIAPVGIVDGGRTWQKLATVSYPQIGPVGMTASVTNGHLTVSASCKGNAVLDAVMVVQKKPSIALVTCGNGKIEGTEQCDDGNRYNGSSPNQVDGCPNMCMYLIGDRNIAIIDDGDSQFARGNLSHTFDANAYGGDTKGCTAGNSASYTFKGLKENSTYDIYATWKATTGADDRLGFQYITTTFVNQRIAPVGVTYAGRSWQKIATIQTNPDQNSYDDYRIAANCNGNATLDAVMAVKRGTTLGAVESETNQSFGFRSIFSFLGNLLGNGASLVGSILR